MGNEDLPVVEQVVHMADLMAGIVLLLLVAALTTILSKKLSKLPLTIALVLIGILLAQLADSIPVLGVISDFKLTPDLVLFVFIPTLIFESAFNLDARQVGRNILPILTLAVPGLILSTAMIGAFMWLVTPFDLIVSLLLGAILSATDPVAVISIFKQLGVPERLTVLVEGESLFNDATSLVMATLLLGIMVAGGFTGGVVVFGIAEFLLVFFGGVVVGWALALIVGETLGRIESDPAIEITFTTILAYFSFIIAEHGFHVSGIMAVVAAGLTMGSWGKSKISPSIAEFMEHFWEYLAYVANVLIFLMVGLQVDLLHLWQSIDLIGLVVVAMLVSRGIVVFGLVPIVGKLPGSDSVDRAFQMVMYWGGLRGAIALAIVLSLPDFDHKPTLVAIVMGAVLFTLLVQGLSIEALVKLLGLDKLNIADSLAKTEGDRNARKQGLERLNNLVASGLFSERIADHLREKCEKNLVELNAEIEELHRTIGEIQQVNILSMRCLAREKARYYELFRRGLISEWAFRELDHTSNVQLDAARHAGKLPSSEIETSIGKAASIYAMRMLEYVPGTGRIVEKMRTKRIVRDYNVAWGRYRASNSVLSNLNDIARDYRIEDETVENARRVYTDIRREMQAQIDEVADQYPEFVETVQQQLGERLLLIAERESVEHAAELGTIQHGIAEKILKDQDNRIRQLKNDVSASLEVGVEELLRKVPFFQEINEDEFDKVTAHLRPRTVPRGTDIIKQGQLGASLFLIARGIAKVFVEEGKQEKQVATLYAGDFFGESALLHAQPRNATARAATPCSLYELNKQDMDKLCRNYPSIREAVEDVDRKRHSSNNTHDD
jgi:CPA1 family monovalent cation:H+ antiporter